MTLRMMKSPAGNLQLIADSHSVTEIRFCQDGQGLQHPVEGDGDSPILDELERQLEAYFGGRLRRFQLPLAPFGTPFQQIVWEALQVIPFGQTLSYGELAAMIGRPSASRAVGAANGQNPIPIVIPCHRVIGKDGSLTGYGGGLGIKKILLELEGGTIRLEDLPCA